MEVETTDPGCEQFDSSTREIKSENYPESYPLHRKCSWIIHIPHGTLIDIQPFKYSLDGSGSIQTFGFVGRTTKVRSGNYFATIEGTWKKETSNQYKMRIEFESECGKFPDCRNFRLDHDCDRPIFDCLHPFDEDKKFRFKMPFSQLRRKKNVIFL